jgi:putative (di)nucleoside polyphosphate hydrolase
MNPHQYFRASAGAMIVDPKGLVLGIERADVSSAWQLPQGGIQNAEKPLEAAHREVEEETSITNNNLQLLDTYPEPLVYELPVEMQNEKTGLGQVQYWFLFRFLGGDRDIDVTTGGEALAWKWMTLDALVEVVADFRKPVYRKLAIRFREKLNFVQD